MINADYLTIYLLNHLRLQSKWL